MDDWLLWRKEHHEFNLTGVELGPAPGLLHLTQELPVVALVICRTDPQVVFSLGRRMINGVTWKIEI